MRKLRKLGAGEHRYKDISGKYRIIKVKNYKRWKEKRTYNKKIRSWEYKPHIKHELIKKYKQAIKKRKETIAKKKKEEITTGRFIEIPEEKMMYRVTVALNYVLHNNYYSYKITGYFRTREEAERKIDEFKERIINQVEKITGYKSYEWWFSDEPNVEIQEIPFSSKYIGTINEQDETVLTKDLKSQRRIIAKKRMLHIPLSKF